MMLLHFFIVGIGGGFGSLLRYYISVKCNKHFIGTWIANVSGSILLGIIVKFYVEGTLPELAWLLIGIGFCGGYTTFSTFGNETIQLILARKTRTAILYIIASFIISIISVYLILLI